MKKWDAPKVDNLDVKETACGDNFSTIPSTVSCTKDKKEKEQKDDCRKDS